MQGPTFFTFPPDLEKSGSVGRPTLPDFFLRQIDFLPLFLDRHGAAPQEDPPTQQANPRSRGRSGRSSGIPNYRNGILINIVEEQLPQGLEAWRNVATLYQSAANEKELRRGEDICDNWVRKLCNNFKKPTGKPGDLTDRIYRCLAIERWIQLWASAARGVCQMCKGI